MDKLWENLGVILFVFFVFGGWVVSCQVGLTSVLVGCAPRLSLRSGGGQAAADSLLPRRRSTSLQLER